MIGHLGDRVSALLDGQLSHDEQERAWSHVHGCHACRDLVEREGWVKTRLVGLSYAAAPAPSHLTSQLKGSLLAASAALGVTPGEAFLLEEPAARPRRASLVALGGGAAGAAVMGVLALGAAPADAPTLSPRVPATSVSQPGPASILVHSRRAYTP
jgi:anti-sigma factor RsiW